MITPNGTGDHGPGTANTIVSEGAPPRPATPEGFRVGVPGPDGRSWVAQRVADGALFFFESEGETGRPLPGPPEAGRLLAWARDGRSLLVAEPLLPGERIVKRELETGARTPVRDLRPEDPTGVARFQATVAPSADVFAAFYQRASTALFLVTQVR